MQALFRPVSMCVPDLNLICEIMLMAEGFQMSKLLSRKFVILYKLCEDLLSKSKHYDWKLRAIKTTLYVAGGMKRAAPELSEDKVGYKHYQTSLFLRISGLDTCHALRQSCPRKRWDTSIIRPPCFSSQ